MSDAKGLGALSLSTCSDGERRAMPKLRRAAPGSLFRAPVLPVLGPDDVDPGDEAEVACDVQPHETNEWHRRDGVDPPPPPAAAARLTLRRVHSGGRMIPHPVEFAAAVSLAVVLLIAAAAVFRPRKPNGIASYGERRGS